MTSPGDPRTSVDVARRRVVAGLAATLAGLGLGAGCSNGRSGPDGGSSATPIPTQLSTTSSPVATPLPSGIVVLVADRSNSTIRAIADGQVTTLDGGSPGRADGVGSEAAFLQPHALIQRADRSVVIADHGNCLLRTLRPDGSVGTLAGGEPGDADGPAALARFDGPYGLAEGPDGVLYIADTFNHRIRTLSPAGIVSTLAGSTRGLRDGPALDAQFDEPTGLALSSDGTLFVADRANHRIRAISTAGQVTTWAGSDVGFTDGTGAAANFNRPTALALTLDGGLVVADCINHRIRAVTPAGVVSTLAGNETGYADGPSTDARFHEPCGIAVAPSGHVLVADRLNHRIRVVDPSGLVTTLAGGPPGNADGPGPSARFDRPFGVAVAAW